MAWCYFLEYNKYLLVLSYFMYLISDAYWRNYGSNWWSTVWSLFCICSKRRTVFDELSVVVGIVPVNGNFPISFNLYSFQFPPLKMKDKKRKRIDKYIIIFRFFCLFGYIHCVFCPISWKWGSNDAFTRKWLANNTKKVPLLSPCMLRKTYKYVWDIYKRKQKLINQNTKKNKTL